MSALKSIPFGNIWNLVWPQTMMMLCMLFIGLTDMWVAGRISTEVQAAIGLSTQVQAFLMVLAMAMGSGSMAAVSQSMGACKRLRGKRYVSMVVLLALLAALILAGAGRGFIRQALGLLQVPEELFSITSYFVSMVFLALPASYIMHIGGTLFRATRNVLVPLYVGVSACVLNVFGDLGFGLGWFGLPAFGASGIAWSTLVSVCFSGLLTLALLKKCGLFPPEILPRLRWMRAAAPYLLKVAGPALLTSCLWQLGYLTLFSIMASLPGSAVGLAGLAAGVRVEAILFMPAMAFNVTASIMVGNALGAGDEALARRMGLTIICLGAGAMSLVAACMWFFVPQLAAFFSADEAVQTQIRAYLFYNILSTPFTTGGLILNGIMTGAGATIYAMVVNTTNIWLVRLPLAWLLAHVIWKDPQGVYAAMLCSMILQSSCMLYVFFRKNWPGYAMHRSSHARECSGEK